MATIIIKDINIKLLEEQRKIIGNALCRVDDDGSVLLNPEEVNALLGVSNMLDAWSDEIYHEIYHKEV